MSRDHSSSRKTKQSQFVSQSSTHNASQLISIGDNNKNRKKNNEGSDTEDQQNNQRSTSTVYYTPQQSAESQEVVVDEKTRFESILGNARQRLSDSSHRRRQTKHQMTNSLGKGNTAHPSSPTGARFEGKMSSVTQKRASVTGSTDTRLRTSDHARMVLSDHSRTRMPSDHSRIVVDNGSFEDDDNDEISVEIDENAANRDYLDLTPSHSYPLPAIEAHFRNSSTNKSGRQLISSIAANFSSQDELGSCSGSSVSPSSSSSSELDAVDNDNNILYESYDVSQTPKSKISGIAAGFGTKKFPSMHRRKSTSSKRSITDEGRKSGNYYQGRNGTEEGMDHSWRGSNSRERNRSQSISTTSTTKTWKRNNNSGTMNDTNIFDSTLSPVTVTTSTQQQLQHNRDHTYSNNKDSRIFGFIRSWGREKSVLDSAAVDDIEQISGELPEPPSLGVPRNLSGPLPSSNLLSEYGNKSFSILSMASPHPLSVGRQRTLSTNNVNGGANAYFPPPSTQNATTPVLSPSTDYNNNDIYKSISSPAPSSPQEKQKTIRQQLLSQIRLQKSTLSPKGTAGGVAELSSDDNDSVPDIANDDEFVNGDDTNEDTTLESFDVSDDDDTTLTEETINWGNMPALPNRFCQGDPSRDRPHCQQPASGSAAAVALGMPHVSSVDNDVVCHSSFGPTRYLDTAALSTRITRHQANPFVQEQRLLLQAVMQLLAERDQVGVEGSMDSSDNIWKKGPLRMLFFTPLISRRKTNNKRPVAGGIWKSRYVELRHGNLCYYEDSGTETRRSTIHLRQADTVVRESLHAQSTRGQKPPGFCFEVAVQGSPTTIWMASSEEERLAWVRAIQSAMIGEDATTNNSPRRTLDLAPYHESLQVYTRLRESLQLATNQEKYLAAIHSAMKEVVSLQIPIEWVREQMEHDVSPLLLGTLKPPKYSRSPQKALKSSISEFWRNMRETTFSINGLTVPCKSYLAPERVIGALTRAILEFDKAFVERTKPKEEHDLTRYQMSELQAVSYARNILLATLRSKERNDAACAAKYLLENSGLVSLEKSFVQGISTRETEEIVYVEVSFAGTDLSDDFLPDAEEMACWVLMSTRRPPKKIAVSSISSKPKYIKTFAVLSGALLSFYGAASPRPHGLKGQLALLSGSTVKDESLEQQSSSAASNKVETDNAPVPRYILSVCTPGQQDRLLAFENHSDLLAWKEAIQLAIDSAGLIKSPPRVVTTTTTRPLLPGKRVLVKGVESAMMVAEAGTKQGIRAFKGAKDIGIRAIKTSTDGGIKVIKGAVGMLLPVKGDPEEQGKLRRLFLKKIPKRPSMHMLLNNTVVTGRREPSVQCVIQTMQAFYLRDPNATDHCTDHSSENDTSNHSTTKLDGWMTIQTKLYQAFLMSGGPSGRIARGVALVEIDFVETNVDEELDDDDIEDEEYERLLVAESNDESK